MNADPELLELAAALKRIQGLEDDVARLQRLCESLALRVAAQSELLTRRAELPHRDLQGAS